MNSEGRATAPSPTRIAHSARCYPPAGDGAEATAGLEEEDAGGVSEADTTKAQYGARAVAVSAVRREHVKWLWPARIPLGALTLLVGDPGLGKSLLTCLIAGKASRAGATVLMATAEDSIAATVRPRLEAVDADLARVRTVHMVREGVDEGLALPHNVAELDELVVTYGATLVVIDPLMAHLPEGVNSWRDQSVRRALAPLHRLAEQRGCAIVVVAHLNKASGGDPLYRIGGSIGITGAARSALLLARDPEDPEGAQGSNRVLGHVKCNLAPLAPSLSCRVVPVSLTGGDTRESSARLVLGREVSMSATDLLSRSPDAEERFERQGAKDFLQSELDLGPRSVKEVQRAAKDAGIAERTLRRAKEELGVRSTKSGRGGWSWALCEHGHVEDRPTSGVATFDSRGEKGANLGEGGQVSEMALLARQADERSLEYDAADAESARLLAKFPDMFRRDGGAA